RGVAVALREGAPHDARNRRAGGTAALHAARARQSGAIHGPARARVGERRHAADGDRRGRRPRLRGRSPRTTGQETVPRRLRAAETDPRDLALGLDRVVHPAVGPVAVDDPAGLHRRVDRRRADEPEARSSEPLRELLAVLAIAVLPHERLEGRPYLAQRERGPGVRDRGLDLAAVADDAGVAEEPLDVLLAETCDALRVEPGEAKPER